MIGEKYRYCVNCADGSHLSGSLCDKLGDCKDHSLWTAPGPGPAPDELDEYTVRALAQASNGPTYMGDGTAPELGNKETSGKVPVELIPWAPVLSMCQVLQFGALKYDDWNWYKGVPMMSLMGSCLRHAFKWICGEDNDDESGLPHLAHMMCNCTFILQFILEGRKELDNRKEMPGLMSLLPIIDTELWAKYAKKGMK